MKALNKKQEEFVLSKNYLKYILFKINFFTLKEKKRRRKNFTIDNLSFVEHIKNINN